MQPSAQIITIGDELLLGQVVDTNSAYIGAKAAMAGLRVVEIVSVQDQIEAIKRAIGDAMQRFDVVIVTGGLGPTKDDITKRAIAEWMGVDLVRDNATYLHVQQMLGARGVEFNTLNEQQADIPRSFTALRNEVGTAPGLFAVRDGRLLFCLPGVPFEMKQLFEQQVLPIVDNHFSLRPILQQTVVTYGLPESELAAHIAAWESALPKYLSLAYLPNPNGIRLRLTALSEIGANEIPTQFQTLQQLIPHYYLGVEPTGVEQIIAQTLTEQKQTMAVAESCTGGLIAARCTALSGASAWFKGGVVAYDNEVKSRVLGVESSLIEEHGAVSVQVVEAMAEGVRRLTNASYAVATSGIAGPTGGSELKPVGTVWIGVASPNGVQSFLRNFGQPRDVCTQRASTAALNYLRLSILKGMLIVVLSLLSPIVVAQQTTAKRPLSEMMERLLTLNYTIKIDEKRVEKARINHSPAPFLPSLAATAKQQQNFGDTNRDNLSLGADFSWRIFDGGAMFYRYAQSRENLNGEQLRMRQSMEELSSTLLSRYFYIISVTKQVQLREHSVRLSSERYGEARSKYNIGAGSGLEMRLAKTDFNADSSNLITARQSLDMAYIALNEMLLYPLDERGYIKDTISIQQMPPRDTLLAMSQTQNSSILLATIGEKITSLELKSQRATRYPTLDFNTGYNIGLASTAPASTFNGVRGGYWGFSVGVNIFNGLETSRKISGAKIENQISQLSLQQILLEISSLLNQQWISFRNNLTLIDFESENARAMELNMTIAMERYRLGDLSGIDFRNIQLQYLAATERMISTLYAAKVSQIELLRLSGTLL